MIPDRRWSLHVEGLVCEEQKVLHQQGRFLPTHSKKAQTNPNSRVQNQNCDTKSNMSYQIQGGEEEEDDVIVVMLLWVPFNFVQRGILQPGVVFLTGEFIIGRVIKAMNNSWHPECFCCDICQQVLADIGFVKNAGRQIFTLPSVN